ncbi:MAG: hypothetical protein LC770_14565, partial [Acidobacteria bacterium]|nr:hypothetical protein [Acidobacteriota bacterium]
DSFLTEASGASEGVWINEVLQGYLLASSSLLILLGSFVLSVPRPTQGQGGNPDGPTKPVKVVNTTAEPVPVTGNITGDINVVNAVRVNEAPAIATKTLTRLTNTDNNSTHRNLQT